jgi:hypothetical protein
MRAVLKLSRPFTKSGVKVDQNRENVKFKFGFAQFQAAITGPGLLMT